MEVMDPVMAVDIGTEAFETFGPCEASPKGARWDIMPSALDSSKVVYRPRLTLIQDLYMIQINGFSAFMEDAHCK